MPDIGSKPPLLDEHNELDEYRQAFGEFGGVERRYAHIAGLETRDNGDPDSLFSTTGRAIVFDSYSLDLGGFKEEIDPEAVRAALGAEDADYHLLWDHDTTLVLARNRNGTLKAEIVRDLEGGGGVDFWGRVAKTSYAADLRVLMDRKDVDECSFAFTVDPEGEDWRIDEDGTIVRRVTKMKRIWDLTICARGAYPQTHSDSVRSFVASAARTRAHNQSGMLETLPTEDRALSPGLVAWDDEQGYNDIACDLESALEQREDENYVYWWVIDLNVRASGSEAIVCRYSLADGGAYYLLSGILYDSNQEPLLPEDGLQAVDMKWVAVAVGQSDDDEGYGMAEIDLDSLTNRKLSERKAREERVLAEAFERVNAVNGQEPAEDEGTEGAPAVENDTEDDAQGHRPTTNDDDDRPTASEAEGEETDELEDEAETEEGEAVETDENQRRAAALARARGRVALTK